MKSVHNIIISQNGIIEILGSSQGGKFRYNNSKLQFSNDGTNWALIEDITSSKVLVVNNTAGNDTTATRGSFSFPYKTIASAKTNAVSGDLIYVVAGNYTDSNILKTGVDMYFEYGSVVTSASAIMTDLSAVSCNIKGYGRFVSTTTETSAGASSNHAIVLSNASNISIEASEISSYSIQGTAKLRISNAAIGGRGNNSIVSIGGSAKLTISNCVYSDYNPQFVHDVNFFECVITDTTFRQSVANMQNMAIRNIGTSGSGSPVGHLTLTDCRFKSVARNIEIGNTTTNDNAAFLITLDNCKFFSNATNTLFTNANVAEYIFINDNIANKDMGGNMMLNKGHGRFYVVATLKID